MPVSISTPSSNLGRHVFGAAVLAFGLITLAWHDYNGWHLPRYIVYPAAAAEIFGGAAIQFRRTAKTGAVVLGAVYLVFALRCVPQIFAKPQIYNSWGNFFEQFPLVTGAAIVYALLSSPWSRETLLLGPLATFVREPMKAPTVNFVNSKNAGETSVVYPRRWAKKVSPQKIKANRATARGIPVSPIRLKKPAVPTLR